MEKFNLYELNNMVMTDRSTTAVHGLSRDVTNDLPKDNANFRLLKDQNGSDSHGTSSNEYDEYISTNDGQLGFMYEDDGNYNNVKSTARNIPREFQAPVLQTNYFDEEYPDLYGKHEIRGEYTTEIYYHICSIRIFLRLQNSYISIFVQKQLGLCFLQITIEF